MRDKKIYSIKSNKVGARLFNRLKFSVVLLLGLGLTGLHAQESINATGGNALGSGGSVSYTVGQMVYQTYNGTNGSVAEGVQQPYEISVVTGLEEAKDIYLSVSAYPNPTTDYLTLEIKGFEIPNLNFQLYDISGKLLQSEKIEGNQARVVMSHLVPATYFVKVIQGNKEGNHVKYNEVGSKQFNVVKTFKIIKN